MAMCGFHYVMWYWNCSQKKKIEHLIVSCLVLLAVECIGNFKVSGFIGHRKEFLESFFEALAVTKDNARRKR